MAAGRQKSGEQNALESAAELAQDEPVLRAFATAVVALLTMVATPAAAQPAGPRRLPVLARQGDHFAIDGRGQFLLLVSYFDGLNRPPALLDADLDWLVQHGIRGIRVWPNSPPRPIVVADGHPDAAQATRLLALVDAAARRGLVVDLTFHREAVICPSSGCTFSVDDYGESLAALAWMLRGRRNVLFDLQNEWNVRSGGLTAPDLVALRERVRAANPQLPVAASVTADYGERDAVARAFDMVAWHGWRDAYGSWAADTEAVVSRLRDAMDGRGDTPLPIYLQEPNRFPHAEDQQPWLDDTAEHYWLAARCARRAGSAAWTFHTAAGFHLGNAIPFAQLLLPGEQRVLAQLAAELAAEPAWGIRTHVDDVADVQRGDDVLQDD